MYYCRELDFYSNFYLNFGNLDLIGILGYSKGGENGWVFIIGNKK